MKKIKDYLILGSLGVVALGGITYCAYNTNHNKSLTKKGAIAAYVALGAIASGNIYVGAREIRKALEEAKIKEDTKKNNLEKEVQE